MGIKGRRVHMIEQLSETIISFQRGNRVYNEYHILVILHNGSYYGFSLLTKLLIQAHLLIDEHF